MASLANGTKIDRYVLRGEIGAGGQGTLWLADDPLEPDRPKALKLVPFDDAETTSLERLRREGRALAKLEHASLVRCHAVVEDPKIGWAGLVLDYVEGKPLSRVAEDASFTPELRAAALLHLARAVAHLHEHGVVHRDLKLANVIVTHKLADSPDDPAQLKLIDFGIAVKEGNPEPLTGLGAQIGTIAYMAPELVAGRYFEADSAVPKIDVFAFGVMAWRLLSGKYPAGDGWNSLERLSRHYRDAAEGNAQWPSTSLEHRWTPVLRRCLALDAADRPANAGEVVELLSRADGADAMSEGHDDEEGPTREAKTVDLSKGRPESPVETADHRPSAPVPALAATVKEEPVLPAAKKAKMQPGFWKTSPRTTLQQMAGQQTRTTLLLVGICILVTAVTVAILAIVR